MYTALKKAVVLQACRLGEASPLLDRLLEEKKVICVGPGRYQVFSSETDGIKGQEAREGDYVKVDPEGSVYPNEEETFLKKHIRLGENTYLQKEQRLPAWDAQEAMCDEIVFLMEQKDLVIDRASEDHYFSAPSWGTTLYGARDAVIIFYSITRNERGLITDAEFNFVKRSVFVKSYERIG